jgi:hypothetical protein
MGQVGRCSGVHLPRAGRFRAGHCAQTDRHQTGAAKNDAEPTDDDETDAEQTDDDETHGEQTEDDDTDGEQTHDDDAEFDQAVDWPTAEYRARNGLPEIGQWCIDATGRLVDSARIRWKCPNNNPDCRPGATYFRENARLYTYLPHGGDHDRRKLRDALLAYRNVIAAGFAWAEDLGLAGEGLMRPR